MTEEGPLSGAEERVGFHIGCAGAGADAAELVFYEEFADERLAEAEGMGSAFDLTHMPKGRYGDILRYLRSTRMLWEWHVFAENVSECLIPVFALKWCGAE